MAVPVCIYHFDIEHAHRIRKAPASGLMPAVSAVWTKTHSCTDLVILFGTIPAMRLYFRCFYHHEVPLLRCVEALVIVMFVS